MTKFEIVTEMPVIARKGKSSVFDGAPVGQPFRFERGRDFDCKIASLRCSAVRHAKTNGLKSHLVTQGDDVVYIKFVSLQVDNESGEQEVCDFNLPESTKPARARKRVAKN